MQKFKTPESNNNTLIISSGDPAGIGTEIILKALGSKYLNNNIQPLIVGCKNNIYKTYTKLINHGIDNIPDPEKLDIIDIPIERKMIPGIVDEQTGSASFKWLLNATNKLLEGKANALVTAPISVSYTHLTLPTIYSV